LRHVADTADIKEGDLLLSSGMGQHFPAGYPVAVVTEVIHDSGQPFAIVRAMPTADLNRSRYMLLVFTDPRTPEQRASDSAEAQEAADRQALEPAASDSSLPSARQGAAGVAPATSSTPAVEPRQ
uniref:rod shape-determining protein MreC n=1 Tax=Pseudomonas sp. TaxID=306 RepID=UPI003569E71A